MISFVPPEKLGNLKTYKYSGSDSSILAPYFQVFWNWAVNLLPETIAPNLVTLIGFFFIIFSFILTLIYTPNLTGTAPTWVYIVHAINLFIYQTMDALDGKQARKTGSSSPLGELFDHGCDAITATLMGLTLSASLQLGGSWSCLIHHLLALTAFFGAQWEQRYTGILNLGIFNVTEAQVITMGVHLVTAFLGSQFWDNTTVVFGFFEFTFRDVAVFAGAAGTILTFLHSIDIIQTRLQAKNLGHFSERQIFGSLLPLIMVFGISILWAFFSPSVLKNRPEFFFLFIGLLMGFLIGKLVLSRLCNFDYGHFQIMIVPFFIGFVNSLLGEIFLPEFKVVQILTILYIGNYLVFAISVIQDFTKTLNIHCFVIKPKSK